MLHVSSVQDTPAGNIGGAVIFAPQDVLKSTGTVRSSQLPVDNLFQRQVRSFRLSADHFVAERGGRLLRVRLLHVGRGEDSGAIPEP